MAKQLVEEEKVFAILGPSTSGESMKIKQYMDDNATLLLSCAAAEAITTPILKWVFKTPQNDANAVRWIFTRHEEEGPEEDRRARAATAASARPARAQLEKLAPEFGIEIAIAEEYDKAAVDLDAEVTKLKAKEVEAVVNWSIEPAQSKVPVSMRKMGWMVPLYQSHGFGNIKYVEAAGPAAEGILFPAGRLLVAEGLPDAHPQKALLLKYKKDYEAATKEAAEHLRRPRLRRLHAARQGHRGRRRRQGEGPRGPRGPQGLRRHRRRLQLLRHGPQRPRHGRLRTADRQGRQVRARPVDTLLCPDARGRSAAAPGQGDSHEQRHPPAVLRGRRDLRHHLRRRGHRLHDHLQHHRHHQFRPGRVPDDRRHDGGHAAAVPAAAARDPRRRGDHDARRRARSRCSSSAGSTAPPCCA